MEVIRTPGGVQPERSDCIAVSFRQRLARKLAGAERRKESVLALALGVGEVRA